VQSLDAKFSGDFATGAAEERFDVPIGIPMGAAERHCQLLP